MLGSVHDYAAVGEIVTSYPMARRRVIKALAVRFWFPMWRPDEFRTEWSESVSEFKGRHFEGEIVLWAVRW